MLFKFIQVVASVIILTLALTRLATADTVREIWIDGHNYEAVLEENQRLGMAGDAQNLPLSGTHYRGHFPEDPDSWVRISRLDSGWEGLAFVFGGMHAIGGTPRSGRAASFSFSQIETPQCGLDHIHGKSLITPDSLAGNAMAQAVSASYDTLCEKKVDGACLMMELELAFDQQFRERFPNDYQGRAGTILNMVEGFYADQFGIIFDTLSLTFTAPGVFDSTTDAGTLLDDITEKRRRGDFAFLKSKRSIFHLISGRDFAGSTAGLAWVGTVCYASGYASGITNAYDSNATTAVVIAHEVGHNLGASHDGTPGAEDCEAGVNIMSPYVVSTADRFSECSDNTIANQISQLNAVEQCFNFPADVGVSAADSNPLEVLEQSSFETYFNIDYREAAESADRFAIAGSIGEEEGRLLGVSVGGSPCSILAGSDAYDCGEIRVQPGLQLSVQAVAGSRPEFTLLQNVTLLSDSGDVKDIRPDNDSILTEIAIAANDSGSPAEPVDVESPGRIPETNGSDSGGGGGGSVNWVWLMLAATAVSFRSRKQAR